MKKDILIEYLNSAMIDSKNYKKYVLGSGLFSILGFLPGVFLGGYCFYIGIVMFLIFIICTCIALKLISKKLTLKRKITIQALIYSCWYFQISSLSTIVFTNTYGLNWKLLLLYLPSLLLCLVLFIATDIMLKSGKFSPKRCGSIKGLGFGFITAMMGWRLGSFLDKTLADDIAAPIILVCFTSVNTLLSIGFLNFQKLYYLHRLATRLEKQSNNF